MTQTLTQQTQYQLLRPVLNERQWRIYLGTEARKHGPGGISHIARLSGTDRATVSRGITDSEAPPSDRIRLPGGGRKKLIDTDPTLAADLEDLLEPKGDPMAAVQWTTKSVADLAEALSSSGHTIKDTAIANILHDQKFSLKANKKNIEGVSHPDRDGQFHLINATVKDFMRTGDPIISVDAKKKELLGNYKNGGTAWRAKGSNAVVNAYDFGDKDAHGNVKKAVPYGVYDILRNAGYVNVGTSADTVAFSVESIRRWWHGYGRILYPGKTDLLITCDGGGSNGSRNRSWKKELQLLANETGLSITIRHYPPATSKWNKIEHRLFSYISVNWRAKPLTSLEVVVDLISKTTTKTGLTVTAIPDFTVYEKGFKVSDEELAGLNIERQDFHGEWNYTIAPQTGGHAA
jgi:Rhodopirellula transposase DDE domain